jgi:hypothetical protein
METADFPTVISLISAHSIHDQFFSQMTVVGLKPSPGHVETWQCSSQYLV